MAQDKDTRLVWSSDPHLNKKCPKCKELVSECTCVGDADATQPFTAVLRIEKSGRGGKTATVVDRLPRNEAFLKELTTALKKSCGSGGTHRMESDRGVIEIQGEKKEQVRAALEKRGIRSKG